MTSKDSLRHEALLHRDRIDPRSEDTEAATTHFFNALNVQTAHIVSLYWPRGREFDPRGIMERLLNEGIACALPVIEKGKKELRFAVWKDGDPLAKGPLGILQPVVDEKTKWIDPDIVVVPLLAFDRSGGRIGYGGGYYDTTLRALRARKSIVAVGVGYGQQAVLFKLPQEPHDEKLDWMITPQKAFCFTR